MIFINANKGACIKKNIHDQAALSINCGMNSFQILSADLNDTNAISA